MRLWLQCANLSLLVGLPGMAPLLERFAAGVERVAGQTSSQLRAAMPTCAPATPSAPAGWTRPGIGCSVPTRTAAGWAGRAC